MSYDIIFNCPECGHEIRAVSELCGSKIECMSCSKEIEVPIPGLCEGLEIGDFILSEKIGAGGMGEVWLAHQISMNRLIALKILNPNLTNDSNFVSRFLAEARMAGKLEHQNIITAYIAGHVGDYYYLATSFIDGIELIHKLKLEGHIPEREALKIVRCIAGALKYAWDEHGMLHRDVKPGNIMIDKHGEPRLMDMGISKSMRESETMQTSSDMIVGTPDYISPEQATADPKIDFRSDIYSLGATLYHLVTGVVPYHGESVKEIIRQHVKAPVPEPLEHNSRLSPQCATLIKIMMAKNKEERHSNWDYVISDIDAVLTGRYPLGKPKTKTRNTPVIAINPSKTDASINLKTGSKSRTTSLPKEIDAILQADDREATIRMTPTEIALVHATGGYSKPEPEVIEPSPEIIAQEVKQPVALPPKVFNADKKPSIIPLIAVIAGTIIIIAAFWFFFIKK
ncbi:MAG: serine/threonine-protein kinase [Victivallaceae bacterium]